MIRKLTESDRQLLLEFLSEEPSINLFIIGDVENYGFHSDIQDIWGKFENHELTGVLLRYEQYYVPYYKNESLDVKEFISIVKEDKEAKGISGKSTILSKFKDVFDNPIVKETYFCELTNNDRLVPPQYDVQIATEDNVEEIVTLLRNIEEFRLTNATVTSKNAVESMKRRIRDGAGRVYFIRDNKEIVTVVQTTAENSMSAMIVGVATLPHARNKGYMSHCLSKLCNDLLQEGKSLCLFYDNPDAGRVYHRQGFQSIGMWTMILSQT